MSLEKSLKVYHLRRIASKRYSVKSVNDFREEIMKENKLTMAQFQELYFQYVNSIMEKYK